MSNSALLLLIVTSHQSVPTSAQLIDKIQRAYDSARTMELDSVGVIDKTKGTAHISFQRPDKLRIKGQTLFGSPYDVIVNGKKAEVFNSGNWQDATDPTMAIATITGISANAGTDVPSILIHAPYGGISAIKAFPATVKREKYKGRDAYRLAITKPVDRTIWVDAKTYYFLRTETKFMEKVMTVDFSSYKVNQPIPANRFTR